MALNIQMKIFAYILSFVVLALTLTPCVDKPTDNTMQKLELTQSTNTSTHQNDFDHCSPFCTCQCCQTSFYVSNITALPIAAEFEISYIVYTPAVQSPELFDFLIPPKS